MAYWLSGVAIAFALGLALPPLAGAATFSGRLAQPGAVWISDGSRPAAQAETTMRNAHKAFDPALLVIAAGGSVRFPNDDPFFHSIYSESKPDPFDIGFYDSGPGKLVPFATAGVVNVRCHIHGSMRGTIIVVDGPWALTKNSGESYILTGVRPGTHVLHEWSADSGETARPVTIAP